MTKAIKQKMAVRGKRNNPIAASFLFISRLLLSAEIQIRPLPELGLL
jgi:hypothetical protein